jgi:hypothetical protein
MFIELDMRNKEMSNETAKRLLTPGTIFTTNLNGRCQIKKAGVNEFGKIMIVTDSNQQLYFYDLLKDQSLKILN